MIQYHPISDSGTNLVLQTTLKYRFKETSKQCNVLPVPKHCIYDGLLNYFGASLRVPIRPVFPGTVPFFIQMSRVNFKSPLFLSILLYSH
jgi:hypothetical protein